MHIILLIPFVLIPHLRDWAGAQASAFALLCTLLLLALSRKPRIELPVLALPWLVWPVFLFALSSSSMEFFSEWGLRLFGMGAMVVLVYVWRGNGIAFGRILLLTGVLPLFIQAYGWIVGDRHLALNSIYAQENVFQFCNMLLLGVAVRHALWVETRLLARVLCFIGIGLLSLSIAMGDTLIDGQFAVSGGDSVGVWLGIVVGVLSVLGLRLWGVWKWKKSMAVIVAALVVAGWALLPLLLSALPIWNSAMPSSITSRITIWQSTLKLVADHIWLGVGFGQYGASIQDYWVPLRQALFPYYAFPIATHSHQLHLLAETGVVGFAFSVLLWGVPLLLLVKQYLRTRDLKLLWAVGMLVAMQSSMAVLEVSQMFFVPQMASWALLVFIVRKDLLESPRAFRVRGIWLIACVPVVAVLLFDRVNQLRSQALTAPCEITGYVTPVQVADVNKALRFHAKNSAALYYIAELKRLEGKYDDALKATEALQSISGTLWPVHRMKAELFHAQGRETEACEAAEQPMRISRQKRDQDLRILLQCP